MPLGTAPTAEPVRPVTRDDPVRTVELTPESSGELWLACACRRSSAS
jgi:hypothetical protein